jgi:hypothetical protein
VVSSGGLQITAGNLGLGVAPVGDTAVKVDPSLLLTTAATQQSLLAAGTGNVAATTEVAGVMAQPATQAAAFSATTVAGFHAKTPTRGAGSTITNAYGLLIDPILAGNTNNYGAYINVPSGGSGTNLALVSVGGSAFLTGSGNTPAASGVIRLPGGTNGLIAWRNVGNTGDNLLSFGRVTNDVFDVSQAVANGIGNGAATNLQAPALGTGGGPAIMSANTWWRVVINGTNGWIPVFQ